MSLVSPGAAGDEENTSVDGDRRGGCGRRDQREGQKHMRSFPCASAHQRFSVTVVEATLEAPAPLLRGHRDLGLDLPLPAQKRELLGLELHLQRDPAAAGKVFKLIDAFEDLDDVQNVYANYEVSPDVQAQLDED